MGNQLTSEKVKSVNALEPLPYEEPAAQPANEIEVVDEENVTETDDPNESDDKSSDQTTLF